MCQTPVLIGVSQGADAWARLSFGSLRLRPVILRSNAILRGSKEWTVDLWSWLLAEQTVSRMTLTTTGGAAPFRG
jgi:hypothetical protein